jgi:autotransporter-associated beta strand protein
MNFFSRRFAWVLIACALAGTGATIGGPLPPGNASFDDNVLSVGEWTNNLDPHWQETGGPVNGNGFFEHISGFSADGQNHLGMAQGHQVWQDLPFTYQANTRYTLTVAAGNRSGVTQLGNQSQYFLADSTGVTFATGILNASLLAAGTFADAPALVFDTPNQMSSVGKGIRILLAAGGSGRSHFDRIRLEATPLIPAGTAVIGNLGAASLAAQSAILQGEITDPGGSAPVVTYFWGTSNGGTNPSQWQFSETLPGTWNGAFALGVNGLLPGTSYYFTVRASNDSGSSWALQPEGFETLPLAPSVVTLPANAIGANQADLAAEIPDDGGESPVLTFHYGTQDGGDDPAAWEMSVSAGTVVGTGSVQVTGLSPSTYYVFRAYAANSAGGAWAPGSQVFQTLALGLPAVVNRSASGITGNSANLRGTVTDDGNDPPSVTIFYGTSDGGTDPSGWQSSVSTPPLSGDFSVFVGGLLPSSTYHFRCRANNALGSAWAPQSEVFSTSTITAGTVVINEFHYNPQGNTSLEEFIELHNPGDAPVDVSGWSLADAVSFQFPVNTWIPAGGFLVVGEDPATLSTRFGASALGPWAGKLSSKGERIDLRDAGGVLRDRVEYSAGFPWPTGADGGGSSAELIHPSLDNGLGGSWRSSGAMATAPATYIAPQSTGWRYKKGTAEASNPVDAWRAVAFDDSSWLTGQTGIGYNDPGVNTTLGDMRRRSGVAGYASVYFRKEFIVPAGSLPTQLRLRVRIDDGCVIWINGHEVDRRYVGAGQLAFNYLAPANHDNEQWDEVIIQNADTLLFGGTNVIAVHGFNTTFNSSDFSMDLELANVVNNSPLPTPGARSSVYLGSSEIAPQIRQVAHSPERPTTGQPVAITARITDPDGMGAVSLSYQIVAPGAYIRLDDPSYLTSWTTLAMRDDGSAGDALAGDSVFTAVIPAGVQAHRRLIRYRIQFQDAVGNLETVPYADDEQPNFAYFVHDGVPAWTGALRPTAFNGFGATPAATYPSSLLESIVPFHLIANATDVTNCQYNSAYQNTRFRGTVVENGKVFDHIQFRVRGIGSTYQSGKNKWNIYFNRSRDYQARDNYGRPYKETWNNLMLNANAGPWASVHRGSAGIEEASSHRLYQLAGMAAMHTQYLHLRVIDAAAEASATSQYDGDLWGLYLGLEPTEGNFLDERGMPDGNLYSIEGNAGDKKRQGPPPAAVDSSDWNTFRSALAQGGQTEAWYRANVDLPTLYTFLAINRLIGNVDVRPGDNYRFYLRPTDQRWVIIPYDLDMMYIAAHHWGGTMDQMVGGSSQSVVSAGAPNVIRAISRHPALAREYRNRCREILSLLASDPAPGGGQIGQLLDEYAGFVAPAGSELNWANLDAAMWNLHPRTPGNGANTGQSSHRGNFFRANYLDGGRGGLGGTAATGSWIRTLVDANGDGFSDHAGITQWMVQYVTPTWPGGTWDRKAMTGVGTGADSDPNRQRGYGYKYLEFESLYGGWIHSLSNPTVPADLAFPAKPVISHAGDPSFAIDDLRFVSSAFSDPQGASDYQAHQWRIAEIQGPGIAGWIPGAPRRYEIEGTWESAELGALPGEFRFSLGTAVSGKTYRVRVRHKDTGGRWSYWSNPIQFTAGEALPTALIHYWNFNDATTYLEPVVTIGGASLVPGVGDGGEVLRHTAGDQGFAGENARNGDVAGAHLRVNNPLGVMLSYALPSNGFEKIRIRYETRRSGQGAGIQEIYYTLDGDSFTYFDSRVILDAAPVVETLDFREVPGVDDNPHFGIRIFFRQGGGGLAGNNRFDNLTVEARALGGGQPRFIPGGDAPWNVHSNWENASTPDGVGETAIFRAPAAGDRVVTLNGAVSIGQLRFDQGASSFRNRIAGAGLVFAGGGSPAVLEVSGTGSGFAELEIAGGSTLADTLHLEVANLLGDPEHGALRLRSGWSGPGGLTKDGLGTASLTGVGKQFTGAVRVEQGVLQVTEPAVPVHCAGVTVLPGGQLRLTSASDAGDTRFYSFGGVISLSGSGRGAEVPTGEQFGVLGALRYDPGSSAGNRAVVTNTLFFPASAGVHVDGGANLLDLVASIDGPGALVKSGGGTLVLSGDSPGWAGGIDVTTGRVDILGRLPLADVDLDPGTILSGSGGVGSVTGAGTVEAGSGVMTAASCGAAGFQFVWSQSGIAGNGMLRLTGVQPFVASPEWVDVFLNVTSLEPGVRLRGGFFAGPESGLAAVLAQAEVRLWVADPGGPVSHGGLQFRPALPEDALAWSVVDATADFGDGPVAGLCLELLVGGDPNRFSQWQALHFGDPEELANPEISGPAANPSGDGVNNLLRYAFGVGPADPVAHLLPNLVAGNGGTVFRFVYDPSKEDLLWRVHSSNDLSDWSQTLWDSATQPVPPSEGGWVQVLVPTNPSGRVFTRLEVEWSED